MTKFDIVIYGVIFIDTGKIYFYFYNIVRKSEDVDMNIIS